MAGSNNVVIDLTNYKDKIGARVPEGTYKVIVDDAEPDTSKAGNPMVNLWLRIHGGDHDGQTLTDRLTITEKSMFRVVGFLQAINFPTPKKRLSLDITKFIGKGLEVTVRDGEPYNGRVKSEISGYARLPKSAAKESAADIDDSAEDLEEPEVDETTGEVLEDAVEETPAPKAKAKKKAEPEAEDAEDDDAQGEVDLDDLDNL